MEETNLNDLAATFEHGHQVTDDEGEMYAEETATEDTATSEEQTTEEESAPAEKPLESESEAAQPQDEDEENTLAEDESGKKYIPKRRFDKVYAKMKELERIVATPATQQPEKPQAAKPSKTVQQDPSVQALEVEMLLTKYPQFDRNSENYSPTLDQMGLQIYNANPGITRLEAARRAMTMAKELSQAEVTTKVTARQIKAQQSDQGMTSRVTSRQATQPNPQSLEEMEAYLKQTGAWDS